MVYFYGPSVHSLPQLLAVSLIFCHLKDIFGTSVLQCLVIYHMTYQINAVYQYICNKLLWVDMSAQPIYWSRSTHDLSKTLTANCVTTPQEYMHYDKKML